LAVGVGLLVYRPAGRSQVSRAARRLRIRRRAHLARGLSLAPIGLYAALAGIVWLAVAVQGALGGVPVVGHFTVVEASKDGLANGEVLAGTGRTESATLA